VRDPRFGWDTTRTYWKGQDRLAEQFLQPFGDLTQLEHAIARWWSSERRQIPTRRDNDSRHASVDRLRLFCDGLEQKLTPVVDAVSNAILQSGGDEAGVRATSRLLGKVLGDVVAAEAPDARAYDTAVRFLSGLWPAEDAFSSAVIVPTISDERRQAWLDQLRPFPSDISLLVEERLGRRRVTSRELEEHERATRARGLVTYLWGRDDDHCTLRLEWSRRADFLLQMDCQIFAEVLDSLPTIELRRWVARHDDFVEDRDRILGVLAGAQAVFADGAWTGKVSAILALENAVHHIEKLFKVYRHTIEGQRGEHKDEALNTVGAFENAEVAAWFGAVFDVVLGRSDGLAIVLVFAGHLVRAATRGRSNGRRWSATPVFVQILADRIGDRATADYMKNLCGLCRGQKEEADELTYLVTGALLGEDSVGTWRWYVSLLAQRDDGIASTIGIGAEDWVYESIAQTLQVQADPISLWRDAWRRLFDTDRERARFDPTDMNAFTASQHLIRVGLGLLRGAERHWTLPDETAVEMWRELRRASTYLSVDPDRPSRVMAGFEFEVLRTAKTVFRGAWSTVLDECIESLVSDPEGQVFAAAALLRSQIPREEVLTEMVKRGCDPVAAIAAVEHRVRRNGPLEAACRIVEPTKLSTWGQ
jgi:hypothetical protein